jgi:hypothetical protein
MTALRVTVTAPAKDPAQHIRFGMPGTIAEQPIATSYYAQQPAQPASVFDQISEKALNLS